MGNRIIPQIGDYTKIQVVSFVQMKLKSDPIWVKRACTVLYGQQTKLERKNHISQGRNEWGFNRNDAPILTHLGAKLAQNRLTLDDVQILHSKIPKYARQLICLAYEQDKGIKLKSHLDIYYKNQQRKLPF